MKILILSDFSPVAINATHYAMDLLQNEQVTFTLLNIWFGGKNCWKATKPAGKKTPDKHLKW
ncbi:hypothetical protein [Salinimicrobium sediminilitoris]|uniref:hypothetical protein n=1 Tax=Salinimicrobium sediminilitoris TaxID=2876715 RepID=UPI001E61F705|nr:hypothetical protein [Salinimicrobium sediminilitoris]MCC8360412.1 hypothetical protein [Salinimicrobium sediminilitoris]